MNSSILGQGRVDRIILVFSALLILAMVGMFTNIIALIILPLPLMIAVLMFLATLDRRGRWPDRPVLVALSVFHAISFALWFIAWLALHDNAITIAGLPTSTGVLIVIAWPFYTILSGPLYAFCAERMGTTTVHAALERSEQQ